MPTRSNKPLALAAGLLAAASLLGACGGDRGEALPQAVLVDVLTELHLAEARVDLFDEPALRDSLRPLARAEALARFGLDTLAWHRALDALAATPDSLTAAYDSVLVRLASEPSPLPRTPATVPTGDVSPGDRRINKPSLFDPRP